MPAGGNLTYVGAFWQPSKGKQLDVDVNLWTYIQDYQKVGIGVVNNRVYVLWGLRMDDKGRVWVDAAYTPPFVKEPDFIMGLSVDNNFLVRYRPAYHDGIVEINVLAPEEDQAFSLNVHYDTQPLFNIDALGLTYYYKNFFAMVERDIKTAQSRYAIGIELYGPFDWKLGPNVQFIAKQTKIGVVSTFPTD